MTQREDMGEEKDKREGMERKGKREGKRGRGKKGEEQAK